MPCQPSETQKEHDTRQSEEHLYNERVHFIHEPAVLPVSRLCILVGFGLVTYVDYHSDDEGGVSEDTTSHAEVVIVYVEKRFIFEGYQAAKLVDHWISVNVHDHAITELDVTRFHILARCIPH